MSTFRIQEFAKLAGVTVRALHHYDRLGLLSPAHRSESGYRLYEKDDLGRLERILVLRYLGLSLREIGALLQAGDETQGVPLRATLSRQHAVLCERRLGIDRVIRAIEHAQAKSANSAEPEWLLYQTILKELQVQENQNWTDKYYSAKGLEAVRERRSAWTPELHAEYHAKWQELFADVQSAIDRGVPPHSEEAIALGQRWKELGEAFTQGNKELAEGLRRLYSDVENWPENEVAARLRAGLPKPEHMAYMRPVWKASAGQWTDRYYSPEGLKAVRERRVAWTTERYAEHEARWRKLFGEVQEAMDGGVSPKSDEARALAQRWKELGEVFTGGDREIAEGLQRLYSDRENWPDDEYAARLREGAPRPEQLEFVRAASRADEVEG